MWKVHKYKNCTLTEGNIVSVCIWSPMEGFKFTHTQSMYVDVGEAYKEKCSVPSTNTNAVR